jgi:hypothetical protein
MTKKELLFYLNEFRDDDPIVIEIDNSDKIIEYWKDTYDFNVVTEKLDEDYTEIRFKLIPN